MGGRSPTVGQHVSTEEKRRKTGEMRSIWKDVNTSKSTCGGGPRLSDFLPLLPTGLYFYFIFLAEGDGVARKKRVGGAEWSGVVLSQ